MIIKKIPVENLLPIDSGNKSSKVIEEKKKNLDDTLILGIESISFPEKFYIVDGHHSVIAHIERGVIPKINVLITDNDLRKYRGKGAINTSHLYTMRNRAHDWYIEARKYGINDFYDLKELIKK
jgi:hypothetical protein